MWPYMGSMGWWMVLWWVAGLVVLVLLVRLVAGTTGGFSPRSDETPEQILKRRYAKGRDRARGVPAASGRSATVSTPPHQQPADGSALLQLAKDRTPYEHNSLPLLQHVLESPSAFTPERLMAAVRVERGLTNETVPPLCVLDFDGDLSDRLADEGATSPMVSWACFHTSMRVLTLDGLSCGIVPRTIGGPYAVLVAEQLCAAGAKLVVGMTSAGRISPSLPLPAIVVIDEAVRDEGTSLHYLPPSTTVATPTPGLADLLAHELGGLPSPVSRGVVWTTDAPYRETPIQIRSWAERGVLAVEMQAASLFAFARARGAQVWMVALVSNDVDRGTAEFDTGGHEFRARVLAAVARAARMFFQSVQP